MQIAIFFEGQDGLNWTNWKRILEIAETGGYSGVFRSDHFTNARGPVKDALETWTSLTYAAATTKTIDFGPLVSPVTFRHPSMLALQAASIDVLAEGRLLVGLGTGWQEREHKEFGIDLLPLSERYERLEDNLEIITRLFQADEPVTWQGTHYALENAYIQMKRKDTRILIGGSGPTKTLPLVAKFADEWNANFLNFDKFKESNTILSEMIEKEGRQQSDVKRSLAIRAIYAKDDATVAKKIEHIPLSREEILARGIVLGTTSQVIDILGKWEEAGLERIMLQWIELDDLDSLEDIAKDVLPQFHK